MGMISDCYQLQENQRKNGHLAVKTPSPLHWFPSCLVDAGRQVAGALSPADPPAAALPSSGPPPAMLPAMGSNSSRAQVPQTLAAQCFLANAEKVQIPAFTRRRRGECGRDMSGIMCRAAWLPLVEVVQMSGKGFPWCMPSTCFSSSLRPCTQTRSRGSSSLVMQGEGRKVIFPFRYRKRLSRYNT